MNRTLGIIAGIALGISLFVAGAVYYTLQANKPTGPSDNWTAVTTSEDGNQIYIDTSSIRYTEDRYVRVWVMISRPQPNKSGDVTSIALTYIDCLDDQFQLSEGHTTDGPWGHGKNTGSIEEGPVSHITPNSVVSDVQYAVCKPLYEKAVEQESQQLPDNKPTVLEHKHI